MPTMHSTFLGVTIFSKFAKWNTTLVDNNSVIYKKQEDTERQKSETKRKKQEENVSNGNAGTNLFF